MIPNCFDDSLLIFLGMHCIYIYLSLDSLVIFFEGFFAAWLEEWRNYQTAQGSYEQSEPCVLSVSQGNFRRGYHLVI